MRRRLLLKGDEKSIITEHDIYRTTTTTAATILYCAFSQASGQRRRKRHEILIKRGGGFGWKVALLLCDGLVVYFVSALDRLLERERKAGEPRENWENRKLLSRVYFHSCFCFADHFVIHKDGVVIRSVTIDDEGVYTCRVRVTSMGTVEERHILIQVCVLYDH